MGAWGAGPFANDDALDWVAGLDNATDSRLLEEALLAVAVDDVEYVEAPECNMALAAAEVVAAMNGQPCSDLPGAVQEWVRGKGRPAPDLVRLARSAVGRILRNSELRELWEQSTDHRSWEQAVSRLGDRLA